MELVKDVAIGDFYVVEVWIFGPMGIIKVHLKGGARRKRWIGLVWLLIAIIWLL